MDFPIYKKLTIQFSEHRAPGVVRVPSESEVPKGSAIESKSYNFLEVPKRKAPQMIAKICCNLQLGNFFIWEAGIYYGFIV